MYFWLAFLENCTENGQWATCYFDSMYIVLHRILVRSSDHYLHGLLYASEVGANMHEREEVVSAIGKEMNLLTFFKIAQQPNIQEDLLKIDEVMST